MIRRKIAEAKIGESSNFVWRGSDISRLESFSDAVFAFAITLLVVSYSFNRNRISAIMITNYDYRS